MTILQHGMVGSAGGYQIDNSLRFRSSASAYLSRTPASAGNRKTWTWSGWVKRSGIGTFDAFFGARAALNDNDYMWMGFPSDETFQLAFYSFSPIITTQVFRDPSAWYHLIVAFDSTQATASNRLKLYVNGVQVTAFSADNRTSITQNGDYAVNVNNIHVLGGRYVNSYTGDFDGYLSEINFIDGQALTPLDFGETNTDGVWVPKAYTGTYGTNGFYLKFNNAASTTTLGYDSSGSSNNWTCNNISLTSGVTYDSMTDTPTNNYCVANAIYKASDAVFSAGNLNCREGDSSTAYESNHGAIAVSSGKWYYEFIQTNIYSADPPNRAVGWSYTTHLNTNYPGQTGSWSYVYDGTKYTNGGAATSYGASWTTNDVIGVALDLDAGTLTYYKNGVSQGTAATGLSGTFIPCFGRIGNDPGRWIEYSINFGQRPFAYTPPTGFNALCTANLPDVAITTSGTFTGNASADGPFVWLNGNPTAMTINGNAVTFATHADKTAGGFKVRTSSSSYNASGSNSYSITSVGKKFRLPNNAQGNP